MKFMNLSVSIGGVISFSCEYNQDVMITLRQHRSDSILCHSELEVYEKIEEGGYGDVMFRKTYDRYTPSMEEMVADIREGIKDWERVQEDDV